MISTMGVGIGASPLIKSISPSSCGFVDLSNLLCGARDAAERKAEPPALVRIHADHLRDLVYANREMTRGVVVANDYLPQGAAKRFGSLGSVIQLEAGRRTGTEQANDQTLQVKIYEAIHSLPAGVLVLGTGDGAGASEGRGFLPALDAARTLGWAIEVVGWRGSMNRNLLVWLSRTNSVFVALDDYYYAVTFVEGGRQAQPVSLLHRRTAEPRSRGDR
jgi:hypothetical protein